MKIFALIFPFIILCANCDSGAKNTVDGTETDSSATPSVNAGTMGSVPVLTGYDPCEDAVPLDLLAYLKGSINGKMRIVTTKDVDTVKIYFRDADTGGSLTMLVETDIGGGGDPHRNPDDPDRPVERTEIPNEELGEEMTEECLIKEPETICRHMLNRERKTTLIKCGDMLILEHDGNCLCRIKIEKGCEICIDFYTLDEKNYEIRFQIPRSCMSAVDVGCP